jgi:hypothetical protein
VGILNAIPTPHRRPWRLGAVTRATRGVECPACGGRIRDSEHAVVLHSERYHAGCALYTRHR